MHIRICLRVAAMGAALSVVSCLGMYGRLTSLKAAGDTTTIRELLRDRARYHVSFAGRSPSLPTALFFDPREEGGTVRFHRDWYTVKSPSLMEETVRWLELDDRFPVSLYRVIGPDGRFYGYMYTNDFTVRIQQDGDGIIRIGSMHPTHVDHLGSFPGD